MRKAFRRRTQEEVHDPAILARIAEMYQRGCPIYVIRQRFKCGGRLVHRALAAHGVALTRTRNLHVPQEEVWRQAAALRARRSQSNPEALASREARANPEEWSAAFAAVEMEVCDGG